MAIYCLHSKCFSFSFNKVKDMNIIEEYLLGKITMETLYIKFNEEINREILKELNKENLKENKNDLYGK